MRSHLVLALGVAGKKVLQALGQIPGRQQAYTERCFPMASFLILEGHARGDEELEMTFGRASFLETDAKVCEAVAQDPAPFPQFAGWLAPATLLRQTTENPRWFEAGIPHRHLGRLALGVKKSDHEIRVRGTIPGLRERQRQMEAHLIAGLGGGFESGALLDAVRMVESAAPGQFSRISLHLLTSQPDLLPGEEIARWPAAAFATLQELEKAGPKLPPLLVLAYGQPRESGLRSAAADCAQWLERALTNARDFAAWTDSLGGREGRRLSCVRVWVGHAGKKEADIRRVESQILVQQSALLLSRDQGGVPGLAEPVFPPLPEMAGLLFPDLPALGKYPDPWVEWRRQSLGANRLIQRCFVPEAWPTVQRKFLEDHYETGFRGTGVAGWFAKVAQHAQELCEGLLPPYEEMIGKQLRSGRSLGGMAEILRQHATALRKKAAALRPATSSAADAPGKSAPIPNGLAGFVFGLRERAAEKQALQLASQYHQRTREAGGPVLAAVLHSLCHRLEGMAKMLEARAESFTAVAILAGRSAELIAIKSGLAGESGQLPPTESLRQWTPELARGFWDSAPPPSKISRGAVLETLGREDFLDLARAHARDQGTQPARPLTSETIEAAELEKLLQPLPPARLFAELAEDPAGEALLRRPPSELQVTLASPPPGYDAGTLLAVKSVENLPELDADRRLHTAYQKAVRDPAQRILLHTEPEFTRGDALS